MSDETEVKTMWSETLLETLYVAMQKAKSDGVVMDVIKDLKAKGYKNDYLVEKVEKKVGPEAATRLRGLLARARAGSGATRAGGGVAAGRKSQGIGSRLKGLFK